MPSSSSLPATRRRVLRALAGATTVAAGGATAGCLDGFRSRVARPGIAWPGFMGGPGRTAWRDAATGPTTAPGEAARWEFDNGVVSTHVPNPAVADGVAYVATPWSDADAEENRLTVAAVDVASASARWTTTVPTSATAIEPPGATAVTDDLVLAGSVYAAVALERETGDVRWRTDHGLPMPAVRGDGVLALGRAEADEHAFAWLDRDDGSVQWTIPFDLFEDGRPVGRTPVASVDAERAYVLQRDRLVAFERGTGDETWTHRFDATDATPSHRAAAVRDGRAYVALSRPSTGRGDDERAPSRVVALDTTTGNAAWTRRVGTTDATYAASNPAVGPGVVLVAGSDGPEPDDSSDDADTPPESVVVALDARSGDVRWRLDVDDPLGRTLLVDGTRAYVARTGPRQASVTQSAVHAISIPDRATAWRTSPRTGDVPLAAIGSGHSLLGADRREADLRTYR
ncbi:PQQ-binding-like beta-propeller repeat protein [Halorubellus sp. PRR65]|uniref:outer membrane protein assembly factor BamB family protein n=1 Tax=Halorubellus sp. PRR65 TaxID=3098148 RepID=UPI002B25E0A5|nr:PQQ-binding-like beta-propeller repeat protein [Halorubellus sp. PRR65]